MASYIKPGFFTSRVFNPVVSFLAGRLGLSIKGARVLAVQERRTSFGEPKKASAHSTTVMSGFPFSTIYVASSVARPVPTFLAEWIIPAGMNRTSPALRITGALPSTAYSHVPSRT
jgi:hypothetical protein